MRAHTQKTHTTETHAHPHPHAQTHTHTRLAPCAPHARAGGPARGAAALLPARRRRAAAPAGVRGVRPLCSLPQAHGAGRAAAGALPGGAGGARRGRGRGHGGCVREAECMQRERSAQRAGACVYIVRLRACTRAHVSALFALCLVCVTGDCAAQAAGGLLYIQAGRVCCWVRRAERRQAAICVPARPAAGSLQRFAGALGCAARTPTPIKQRRVRAAVCSRWNCCYVPRRKLVPQNNCRESLDAAPCKCSHAFAAGAVPAAATRSAVAR